MSPSAPPIPAAGHVLVLDFDGTLSQADLGDLICDRFAAADWRRTDLAWERGELSLFEAQERIWGTIQASGAEVLAHALAAGRLRAGLDELLQAAADRGVPAVIASGGFDFYIRALLGERLQRFSTVLCNQARFDAGPPSLTFPHREAFGCPRCPVCKGRVCDYYRQHGARVTFVGDGNSDRCAAGRADRLFAVAGSKLARHCQAGGHPCQEFETLHELIEHL